jgi:phosphoenolpyruvate-protein kinase (PTS system EI component)
LLSQLPGVLPLLLGLGFRLFSVDAAYIPYLAAIVRKTHVHEASALAREVCRLKTSPMVKALLGSDAIPAGQQE